MNRLLVTGLFAGLLSGCSTLSSTVGDIFDAEENLQPPAELTNISHSVPLVKRWSVDVGVGFDEQFINLVPAAYGNKIIAADRRGRVMAFDRETGKQIWETKTQIAISAGPGAGEGMVLVGGSEAEVVALDSDTGSLLWQSQVSSEVLSVPQVDRGMVIVQSADGKVAGLSAEDGKQVWNYDRTVPVLTLRGTSTPAVQGGIVIAGFASGKIAALSTEKGFVAWETSVAVPSGRSELSRIVDIDSDPVIVGNGVFVTTYQGHIAVINIQNGELGWQREMSSHAGLRVDYSQVYVTDDESHIWALARDTGVAIWKQEDLQARSLTAPEPFADEYVAVGDFEGYLHLLSRGDGRIVARTRVDSSGIKARPMTTGDMLFVYGNSGKLVAYSVSGN